MIEEADRDANRHKAPTTIYEGSEERLYRSEDYDECSQNLLRSP